jgi:hypothetical protein
MEWRVCPRFPDYEVSDAGGMRRCKPGMRDRPFGGELKANASKNGYRTFSLCVNAKNYTVCAYRMVAEAFLGPPPFKGASVCHNDGTKVNDSLTNLRWDSHAGNMADKAGHGVENIGVRNAGAKLNDEAVEVIRARVRYGEMQKHLAVEFGIAHSTISKIVHRRLWKHVA